ncbi:MAG TPA: hypothetical protein DEF51_41455, partial [Myxococcales bacterium]|nr:hypothetical protein [Myxococcales bacterium]
MRDRIVEPELEERVSARPAFATLAVRSLGERELALEVTRDATYAHRRHVSLRGVWEWIEAEGEVFHDVVVHPSGDLTLAVEDTRRARDGFSLVRSGPDGEVR